MSFIRIIATVLILVMTSAPALASVCATTCAVSGAAMANSSASVDKNNSATASDHCRQMIAEAGKSKSGNHYPGAAHKSCAMTGCNFSQAAPLATLAQVPTPDFASVPLSYFNPSAFSAELSPPIKPPA